jgi:hypothetical protein
MTTTNTTTPQLVVFLDTVGRTILAEQVSSDDTILAAKNPVVLETVPVDDQGKMSIRLLPIFFKGFLADQSKDVVISYNKSVISVTDIDALDFRLQAQYTQINNPSNTFGTPPAQQNNANPSVINLFDEA